MKNVPEFSDNIFGTHLNINEKIGFTPKNKRKGAENEGDINLYASHMSYAVSYNHI